MIHFTMLTLSVLIVFYMYLLARWQHVRRPWAYLVGSVGLVLALAGEFFAVGGNPCSGVVVVTRIFQIIGAVIALTGAIVACFGGKMPVWDNSIQPKIDAGCCKSTTPPAI